jgi:hypothetical protein
MPLDYPLLSRGVYRAPCLSPGGYPILYAVDHSHRHIAAELGGVVYLMPTDDPIACSDKLWDLLSRLDPVSAVA